ncbi:MAG: adenosine kinase [Rhodospirillales bacterium]|nr:adenosine kinase [Rhodospirillales bacterium]MCB9994893.1 adenosine kinase [Rhodospirillales bacterium]
MLKPDYDIVAIGNAMVDVLAHVNEDFLRRRVEEQGLIKGGMTLVESDVAVQTLARLKEHVMKPGGSACNVMFGIRSFGGRCAFIGKVADDHIGRQFREFLAEQDIGFNVPSYTGPIGAVTGRSLIMITPDGVRSMATFLGASKTLRPEDVDEELVSASRFLYLEGYLFDQALAQKTFHYAADIAKTAGRKIVLNLSDPQCVERHKSDFLDFVRHQAHIVFATEKEIKALYGARTLIEALNAVREMCEIAAITRSEKGSVIVSGEQTIEIEARKVEVVDTTGAGDQYAAGFLHGLTRNVSLPACGRLATAAASQVITHDGGQPQSSYSSLIIKELVRTLGKG